MDRKSPSLFISYCREDGKDYKKLTEKLISDLIAVIPNLKIYYDKEVKKELVMVSEFEGKIRSVDLVLVLCSKKYKYVILEKDSVRHAYREYKDILDVLALSPRRIQPVIISGDKNSIPEELMDLEWEDLTNVMIQQKKSDEKAGAAAIIKEAKREHYNEIVKKIAEKIRENFKTYLNTCQPDATFQEVFNNLFHLRESKGILPKACMILPTAYEEMFNAHKLFVIGRKGSGKTTFLEMLKHFDEDRFNNAYKSLEIVKYEDLPITQVYRYWQLCESDAKMYSKDEFLRLFFEIYVFLYSVCIIGFELEQGHLDDDNRKDSFKKITDKLLSSLRITSFSENKVGLYSTIGATAIDILSRYLLLPDQSNNKQPGAADIPFDSTVFKHMSDDSYSGSMRAHLTWRYALAAFFNQDGNGEADVRNYTDALNACKKRILFALDGFDNLSDTFRLETNQMLEHIDLGEQDEGKVRTEFLRMFDAYLIITLDAMKNNAGTNFCKNIDICVIFPRDRYEVFHKKVRDISKISFSHLSWGALELMEMVTLRLEYFLKKLIYESDQILECTQLLSNGVNVHNLYECSQKDVWNRFNHAVTQLMPNIPLEITLDNGCNISLFNYLLSLSLWRPRDILHYIEMLFSISSSASKTDTSISAMSETVREGMTSTSVSILKNEFIQEYQTVFMNITDVLQHLRGISILCSGQEIKQRLKEKFISSITFDDGTFQGKLRTLFELGVIGFRVDAAEAENYRLLDSFCYVFSHGRMTHENVNFNERLKLVINPMFKTYLFLKTDLKSNEVIGDYSIDKINRLYSIRHTLPDW